MQVHLHAQIAVDVETSFLPGSFVFIFIYLKRFQMMQIEYSNEHTHALRSALVWNISCLLKSTLRSATLSWMHTRVRMEGASFIAGLTCLCLRSRRGGATHAKRTTVPVYLLMFYSAGALARISQRSSRAIATFRNVAWTMLLDWCVYINIYLYTWIECHAKHIHT